MGDLKFENLAVHAGHEPDPVNMSRGVAVHRTTSFVFKSVEHGADLFALRAKGNIYTRLGNPTQDILERRITALEGGAASVAFASGTSAIFSAVITIARNGDEIVSANNLYGGTYTQFAAILTDFGIKTRSWIRAIRIILKGPSPTGPDWYLLKPSGIPPWTSPI